jgi:hypothetical protein
MDIDDLRLVKITSSLNFVCSCIMYIKVVASRLRHQTYFEFATFVCNELSLHATQVCTDRVGNYTI